MIKNCLQNKACGFLSGVCMLQSCIAKLISKYTLKKLILPLLEKITHNTGVVEGCLHSINPVFLKNR